jgi:hypothetical protein
MFYYKKYVVTDVVAELSQVLYHLSNRGGPWSLAGPVTALTSRVQEMLFYFWV